MTTEKTIITIGATVNAPAEKVWKFWTTPEDIVQWNSPSPDWHTPKAHHELKPGGNFLFRMEARDGSFGFDFGGVYDVVRPNQYIEYTLGDGRKVKTEFIQEGDQTRIIENFEAESTHSLEQQQTGWQAILDNFKRYAESH